MLSSRTLACLLLLGSFCQQAFAAEAMMDRVLVIVNEDVITQSEFDYRKANVIRDLTAAGQPVPPELPKQLLETMVSDRLQVQEASRRGIEIGEDELDQTLVNYARNQNLTLAQLKQNLANDGQPFERFRETVRDSMTIGRFTEFYARSRVVVPEYEIDGWLAANKLDQGNVQYQLARLFIGSGPDGYSTAQRIREEIQTGLDFQEAALQYSQSQDAQDGGLIGWTAPEQLPDVYKNAVKNLNVGEITNVLETPNGFHILKLLDLKGDRTEIVQNSVRHILIAAESRVAKLQATKRILELRKRIQDGEDFEGLARIYSDDSVSAATGGSLGWVSPGQMVQAFEVVFAELPINQLSQPVETQFGVHLIRVEDRRKQNISDQVLRSRAENVLRRQRADREFSQWVRELLEGAYVEHVYQPS